MQYTAVALTLAATAAARHFDGGHPYHEGVGQAKVVNRCDYPIWLWSIDKEMGCPEEKAFKLETGDSYSENMRNGTDGGISIKLSKTTSCGSRDITQLEYKLEYPSEANGFIDANFLDMSYVDCKKNHGDCPGRLDGYYMQSGNQVDEDQTSNTNNEHCPVFNVKGGDDVAAVAYILDFDRQTKSCTRKANLDLYLCGSQAPGEEAPKVPELPKPSSKVEEKPEPTPEAEIEVKKLSEPAPKVEEEPKPTPVEEPPVVTPAPVKPPVIKTEVVYVTKFVKRHGHARRHHH